MNASFIQSENEAETTAQAPTLEDQSAAEAEFANRQITLSSGQRGLRSALPVTTAVAGATASGHRSAVMDFIASDATLDRAGEILQPEGWRLDNFRRNPVFQNAHNYGNILFTLGRATEVEVRDRRLFLRVLFAVDINPLARIACELYRGGFLRAVSVGFIPLRWENGSERTPWRRRFLEQELIEVSAVAVPANPNALAMGIKSGAIPAHDLQEWADLLRAATGVAPVGDNWRGLLDLARETARLLRAW